MSARVLIVDDEEGIRYTFERFLEREGYGVDTAADYESAMELCRANEYSLIVADIVLGGRTGIDLLQEIRRMGMNTPVIIITGVPDVSTASDAVRLGAFDYVTKPMNKSELLRVVRMALDHKRLVDENTRFKDNMEAVFRSVGEMIITVDRDMRLLQYNESAGRLCGLSGADVGRKYSEKGSRCPMKCMGAIAETVEKGAPVEYYRVQCRRPGRDDRVLNISVSPLMDSARRPYGAVMVGRDVTRIVRLEGERERRGRFCSMIGISDPMQKVYSLIEDLAGLDTTVLILGESGTGKELVVDSIHELGLDRSKPLVKVNCAGLSETLLESELFGHVKGAYTGAHRDNEGRFEMADGGIIFLDEIGDVSPRMQARLLRVLQYKEFERVGESRTRRIRVRVVAATNRDLKRAVAEGRFREDLYWRLKVVELHLPPLRERREDIPLLADHFARSFAEKFGRAIEGIEPEAASRLVAYDWPGNVRQIEHAMEHACIHSKGGGISVADLPEELRTETDGEGRKASGDMATGAGTLVERERIVEALRRAGGNKAKAARLLSFSRQTLYRKIGEMAIEDREIER